jgi:hypothetical protein
VVAVLTGRLGRCRVYSETTAREIRVELAEAGRLARDGETFDGSRSFTVRKRPRSLVTYRLDPNP